jgi:surfeit locus 1 family protein
MEYMRVKVRGHFEHAGEMHIAPRAPVETDDSPSGIGGSMGGGRRAAGANVITPFVLENGFVL